MKTATTTKYRSLDGRSIPATTIRRSRQAEIDARRAIEDRCGFIVQDANIILQTNCPNVDLIAFAPEVPVYVQVKSSERPAGKDHVVVDGSPWTEGQLYEGEPIFNRRTPYHATLVVIVDRQKTGETNFYIASPATLEPMLRARGLEHAAKPKKDGSPRSISFRKELPRGLLAPWRDAWHLFKVGPKATKIKPFRTLGAQPHESVES